MIARQNAADCVACHVGNGPTLPGVRGIGSWDACCMTIRMHCALAALLRLLLDAVTVADHAWSPMLAGAAATAPTALRSPTCAEFSQMNSYLNLHAIRQTRAY